LRRSSILLRFSWLASLGVATACGQGDSTPEPTSPDAATDAFVDGTTSADTGADAGGGMGSDGAVDGSETGVEGASVADSGSGSDATLTDAQESDGSPGDAVADESATTLQDSAPIDASLDEGAPPEASTDGSAPPEASTDDAGLPSSAACSTGGHVFWVHGDPGCPWFAGTETDGLGSAFAVEAEAYYATYDGALVQVTPAEGGSADWWSINFNTWKTKQAMVTGVVYDVAAVNESEIVQHGTGCPGNVSGHFRVDEYEALGDNGGIGTLLGFTAVFVFKCENVVGELHGCVHF